MNVAQHHSTGSRQSMIKKGLLLLLALFLIIIISLVAIVLFVDPNHYKDRIESLARNKANIKLSINGNLSWTLYPWLGIAITDTTISAIDDSDNPIASVSELSLSLKLIALIKGDIEIDQLHVDGLNLSILTHADGSQNIDSFFSPKENAQTYTQSAQDIDQPKNHADNYQNISKHSAQKPDRKLDIRAITFSNTEFEFNDTQKGRRISGHGIDFMIGGISSNTPSFTIKSALFNQGNITFLDINSGQGYAYHGINFALQNFNIERDSQAQNPGFSLAFDHFTLDQGKFIYSERDSGKSLIIEPYRISGNKVMVSTLTQDTQSSWFMNAPWFIDTVKFHNLAIYYRAQKDALYQKIENLNFDIAQLSPQSLSPVSFSARLTDFPAISGEVTGDLTLQLDLPKQNIHLTKMDINMSADKIPGKTLKAPMILSLQGDGSLDQNQGLTLTPFSLKIDDSTFSGSLHITSFNQLKGSLNISGDSLNLNHYLVNDQTNQHPKNSTEETVKTMDKAIFTGLSGINFDISAQLKHLTFDKITAQNLDLSAAIQNQTIQINQFSANTLGGNIALNGAINGQTPAPDIKGKITLTQLPLVNLFQFMQKEIPLRGNLNLTGDFSATGLTTTEIINHLAGNAHANISQGELIGINYKALACEGISLLAKNSFPKNSFSKNTAPQTTKFKTLSATVSISNGIIQNNALKMEIPGLSANGSGTINLNRETLDYRIGLHVNESTNIPNCKIDRYLKNVTIPLRCQGSFINAGANLCGIDQDAIGKMVADVAKSKIESTIHNKLQDALPPILQKPKQDERSPQPKPKDVIKAFEGLFK